MNSKQLEVDLFIIIIKATGKDVGKKFTWESPKNMAEVKTRRSEYEKDHSFTAWLLAINGDNVKSSLHGAWLTNVGKWLLDSKSESRCFVAMTSWWIKKQL